MKNEIKKTYVFVDSGECVDAATAAEAIEKLSRWYPRPLLNEDTVVTEEVAAAILREEKLRNSQSVQSR